MSSRVMSLTPDALTLLSSKPETKSKTELKLPRLSFSLTKKSKQAVLAIENYRPNHGTRMALVYGETISFRSGGNSMLKNIRISEKRLVVEFRQEGKRPEDFKMFTTMIDDLINFLKANHIDSTVEVVLCYHCVTIVGENQVKKVWRILRSNNSFDEDAEYVAKAIDNFHNERRCENIVSKL